ncbi:LCP family protein [Williamsia sp. MIQD14]|uniref:LCP family protein n=1 Tax=Williamsia sp. MIQD14 TaxID=3425703 RepID=UPI003DA0C3E0
MPPERSRRHPDAAARRHPTADAPTEVIARVRPRHHRRATARPVPRRRSGRGLVRPLVALASCAVLLGSGLAWGEAQHIGGGFHTSDVLAGAPKSTGSAENILLIGLDSRKDRDGNDLPASVLAALHAGDGDEGGYNTNTLILVHVPADGQHITAFSIPRDDYVAVHGIDGYDHAKIKEAYGLMKAQAEQKLVDQGVTDPATLETDGRDAGRAETLQTVRELTGVPIDRFAEVSLVGFYDIAKALGGVKVCLDHAVNDSYSGAHFSAGVHTLNASQALAFVRQRHGLDNGDLDRTHRQQAFLISVAHSLQSSGIFGDLDRLNALVAVAQRDIVLSSGWDIVDYAHRIGDISGQNLAFRTLPVVRYDTVDNQDVNIVDPAAIRTQVQTAFGIIPPQPPTSTATPLASTADTSGSDTSSTDSGSTDPTSQDPAPDQGAPVTSTASGVPCVN